MNIYLLFDNPESDYGGLNHNLIAAFLTEAAAIKRKNDLELAQEIELKIRQLIKSSDVLPFPEKFNLVKPVKRKAPEELNNKETHDQVLIEWRKYQSSFKNEEDFYYLELGEFNRKKDDWFDQQETTAYERIKNQYIIDNNVPDDVAKLISDWDSYADYDLTIEQIHVEE